MTDLELKAHDLTLFYIKREGFQGFMNVHEKAIIEPEIYAEYYKLIFERILDTLKREITPF